MRIKISETKKGKKTIEEFYEFPFCWTIVNYYLYLFISTILISTFILFILSEGLDTYNRLWTVMFFSVFIILWIKQSYGNFSVIYNVLLKRRWLSSLLGELHGLILMIFVFFGILGKGTIVLSFLLNISVIIFSISLILTIIISIYPYLFKKREKCLTK